MRCSVGCKTPPDTAAPDACAERTRFRLDVLLQADAVDMFESLAPRQPGDRGACREYKSAFKWKNLAKSLA